MITDIESRLAYLNQELKDNSRLSAGETLNYYDEILGIYDQIGDFKSKVRVMKNLIQFYVKLGQFERSWEECLKLLKICEENGFELEHADCLNMMGQAQWQLGNFDMAMECIMDSLTKFEKLNNLERVVSLTGNLGLIYSELKEYNKAIEVTDRALEMAREADLVKNLANLLNNKGVFLLELGNVDEALVCYTESTEIREKLKLVGELTHSYLNLGEIYENRGDYETALQYLLKAEEISGKTKDVMDMVSSLEGLGHLYSITGDYDRAIDYLEKALGFALNSRAKSVICGIYEKLSSVYESKEDYKKALDEYKNCSRLQREIFDDNSAKKIAELKVKFETRKKLEEAELLKSKNDELAKINKIMNRQNKELRRMHNTLEVANRLLRKQAVTDPLTGLYNRHSIEEALKSEVERARSSGQPFTVIMLDLDKFKSVNDVLGHLQGDNFLRKVGELIIRTIRGGDIPFRYGGEEFLIILPLTCIEAGFAVADRLRKGIKALDSEFGIEVTVSGSVRQWNGQDFTELIREVDELLYLAKKKGRDRIEK